MSFMERVVGEIKVSKDETLYLLYFEWKYTGGIIYTSRNGKKPMLNVLSKEGSELYIYMYPQRRQVKYRIGKYLKKPYHILSFKRPMGFIPDGGAGHYIMDMDFGNREREKDKGYVWIASPGNKYKFKDGTANFRRYKIYKNREGTYIKLNGMKVPFMQFLPNGVLI